MDNFLVAICPQNLLVGQNKPLMVLSMLMFGVDILVEWGGILEESQLSTIANIAS